MNVADLLTSLDTDVVAAEPDRQYNCFNETTLHTLFAKPRVVPEGKCQCIYTTISLHEESDLTKQTSDVNMISLDDTSRVILGIERIETFGSEYESLIVNHINTIRHIAGCEDAKIVLCIESGTGLEAGHVIRLVQAAFPNVISNVDQRRRPGNVVAFQDKMKMMLATRNLLDLGVLTIHESAATTMTLALPMLLQALHDQLHRYKFSVRVDNEGHMVPMMTGRDGKYSDGLAHCLQSAVVYAQAGC